MVRIRGSLGQDMNLGPPKYKAGVPTAPSRHLVSESNDLNPKQQYLNKDIFYGPWCKNALPLNRLWRSSPAWSNIHFSSSCNKSLSLQNRFSTRRGGDREKVTTCWTDRPFSCLRRDVNQLLHFEIQGTEMYVLLLSPDMQRRESDDRFLGNPIPETRHMATTKDIVCDLVPGTWDDSSVRLPDPTNDCISVDSKQRKKFKRQLNTPVLTYRHCPFVQWP